MRRYVPDCHCKAAESDLSTFCSARDYKVAGCGFGDAMAAAGAKLVCLTTR